MSSDLNQINQISGFPQVSVQRAGNCEKYFDKINADEWVPDTLVPLAFDRASEAKVGVFYAELKEQQSNNDHIIVRILNKQKQNLTMYSIKLFRVGTVSIHINKGRSKKKRFFWETFPKSVYPPTHPRVFVRFGKTKGEIWVEKGDFRGDLRGF